MNELKLFENPEFGSIRVIEKDGEPWFVLSDVCKVLGLTTPARVAERLEDDEKGVSLIHTLGGEQKMTIINEAGLYSVILRSDKPIAKPFRRWVTHEVVPSIRKTGSYSIAQDSYMIDDPVERAKRWIEERQERDKLAAQIEADKPKVIFSDAVSASTSTILIGDLAKILKQNGVNIGQKRLFEWMREHGYLIKSGNSKNMPTQRSMEMGLFEVKETVVTCPDGHIMTNKTTKVAGKGQQYFINLFLNKRREREND